MHLPLDKDYCLAIMNVFMKLKSKNTEREASVWNVSSPFV